MQCGINMKIQETEFKDLFLILPEIFNDQRGFFMELFHKEKYKKLGINISFVQINQSCSNKNVVRGLHFQWDKPLGKLIRVSSGKAYAVFVDLRKNSRTFGNWIHIEMDTKNNIAAYAPFGFAAGFCALEDNTNVEYFYTEFYNPQGEATIKWNDQTLGIKWPVTNPILSERDANAQTFNEWLERKESDLF